MSQSKIIRIYLDNCCFNRPYDTQSNTLVRLEAEAKLVIQELIKQNELELVWSYILESENDANPFQDRKETIENWKYISKININENETVLNRATNFFQMNLKPKDSIHLSCAIESGAVFFITTDKDFLKKSSLIQEIKILTPIQFLELLEDI